MLGPDYRVSYISQEDNMFQSLPDHHQVHTSKSVPHAMEYFGMQWDPIGFYII